MIDVFIDMTNAVIATLGRPDGGRCAMGSALWTIGIPHDRLLGNAAISNLSEADQKLCREVLPLLERCEGDIAAWYDCMVMSTRRPDMFDDAYEEAMDLIRFGKLAGINFIIASPISTKAVRPAEPAGKLLK